MNDDHYAKWQECLSANAAKDARIAELEARIESALPDFQKALIKVEAMGAEITNLKGLLGEAKEHVETVSQVHELNWDSAKELLPRIDSALKEGKE